MARLRFYERFGARPIIGTEYETPLKPEEPYAPHLVYDDLRQHIRLRRNTARAIVRAILEGKYGNSCPPGYIDRVVNSFKDDPVRLRKPRYFNMERPIPVSIATPEDKRIALVINDQHAIHHVRERGYVESPVRIATIQRELERTDLFASVPVRHFSEDHIKTVHAAEYVEYFKRVCANLKPGESIYPYVFPIRNVARPPKELAVRAGYYCVDTFTPLNRNAYLAARRAVDCTLTAAKEVLRGRRLAYALVRPPGHHAERRSFGGFCYFNSAAVAAQHLSIDGKVAILDLDYHHGNGQQDIFYERSDVLTISIHGHPHFAYPYFSGFEDEKGTGDGEGYNVNIPLPESVDGARYHEVLSGVLKRLTQVSAPIPRCLSRSRHGEGRSNRHVEPDVKGLRGQRRPGGFARAPNAGCPGRRLQQPGARHQCRPFPDRALEGCTDGDGSGRPLAHIHGLPVLPVQSPLLGPMAPCLPAVSLLGTQGIDNDGSGDVEAETLSIDH